MSIVVLLPFFIISCCSSCSRVLSFHFWVSTTCQVGHFDSHIFWFLIEFFIENLVLTGGRYNWTQPVYVKTAQDLISRMDDKRSKVFNAHQGWSQWLNVVPCKNLGLKLDYQQLRISFGLRLGANICVAHTCHFGKSGGCKWVEFFWPKGQRSNLLIELQGSNGMRSNFIVFVVCLGRFAPFVK